MEPIFDAQAAMGFVLAQATHVESTVYQIRYPDIQYPALTPVDTSAHPFAQTVTYYSADKFGKAGWINGNADDIPMVGSERSKHETAVYTAGIGYGWGWEEVGVAMMMGISLQSDDAATARRAYEEMVDDIMLHGDAEKGFFGLLDYTQAAGVSAANAVVPASPTYGDWDDSSIDEDDILKDVNDAILGVYLGTKTTTISDTVLMSPERLNLLATTRLGDTTMTVLEFLRQNNTYTAITGQRLTIRAVRGLETAGAGNTQRLITYRRDPQVLKAHVPMPHRFLPVYQDGPLHWKVPGVFRLGGLDIRLPKEVRYIDGI